MTLRHKLKTTRISLTFWSPFNCHLHFSSRTIKIWYFLDIWRPTNFCFMKKAFTSTRWQQSLALPQCLKTTQNVAFLILHFWHFLPIFVTLKMTCLVTLIDHKLLVFQKVAKLTIFGIFNWFCPLRIVNLACFARNVEGDFFCDFQTLWPTGQWFEK